MNTQHLRIMTANEVMMPWEALSEYLNELNLACSHFDQNRIRELLLQAPTGFTPTDEICDVMWIQTCAEEIQG